MSTSPPAYHTAALESMPQELQGLSEGEDSSLDDSMNSKSSTCSSDSDSSSCADGGSLAKQHHQQRPRPPRSPSFSSNAKKRVSWDRIHTREYALVVGDHPLCQDGLPVSLGWQYVDHATPSVHLRLQHHQQSQPPQLQQPQQQQPQVAGRHAAYMFPRRLSYEERRNRLQAVSNLTLDEIKSDEIDLVVRTLQESWGETNDVLDGLPLGLGDWMEPDPLPTTSTIAAMAGAVDRDGDAVMMDGAAVANNNHNNKNERSGTGMDQLLLFGDDSDDDLSNFDWGD